MIIIDYVDMFVLQAEIQIGKYTFRSIHEVEITKSVDELGDTATIKLPTKFMVGSGELYTEEAIKAGDAVTIKLGYEDKYFGVEFQGFVAKVSPKIPMEIKCEDSMWLLRRKNIHKAWNKGVSLKEVLQEVVAGTGIELSTLIDNEDGITFDKLIIQNANGTQVLQKLKQDYALTSFIDDEGKLYCGLQQATNVGQSVIYDLNYNLVENGLEFRTADERKIKVRYTYMDKANKKKSVEVGDADGELRTFHTTVVSDESQLKKMAQAEIEKLKYDGYDGDVTSFLIPYATRGMTAKIVDTEHPNRKGNYFIKEVTTSFGTSGARRKVKIGNRL